MKYVITGGAGHISKPLALQLIKAGHTIVVLGRNENHLKELVQAGAQTAIGSLEDIVFLKKAFVDADAVYTMCPPNFITDDLKAFYENVGKNYAQAIQTNGIKYVVNLSSIGAHLPQGAGPASGLHHIEEALNTLKDVNIKHLRASYLYHNLIATVDMIKGTGIMGSNFSNRGNRFPLSDYSDIVPIVAEELLRLNFRGHSVQYLASDETDTDEIAHILGKAIGKPDLKWIKFSDEEALQGMLMNGLPKEIAGNLVEMGKAINSGEMLKDYWKHRPVQLGTIKLEDFAFLFSTVYNASE